MLLAILLPFLSFIVRGKILTGILCFILQITLIGWIPAAIWAAMSLNNERAEKRNKKLIQAVRRIKDSILKIETLNPLKNLKIFLFA